jgi:hypothetical protein
MAAGETETGMDAPATEEQQGSAAPEHEEDDVAKKMFYARWPLRYGAPGTEGKKITPGQIVILGGFQNDEKLTRLGYLAPYDEAVMGRARDCRFCEEKFINERALNMHGRQVHEPPRNEALERLAARSAEIRDRWAHMNDTERSAAQAELDSLSETAATVEDQGEEQMYQRAQTESPLYLDKTAASASA